MISGLVLDLDLEYDLEFEFENAIEYDLEFENAIEYDLEFENATESPKSSPFSHKPTPNPRYNSLMAGPHDQLFRATFSQPEQARAFLREVLPKAVAKALDWEALASQPESFVDEALKERQADLLFSVLAPQVDGPSRRGL